MGRERENPYVGLEAFTEQDGDYFFGRDEEGSQLTSLVIAHQVVLFYAQSGAGKTSLLQASVIPSLKQDWDMTILPVARVGGDPPTDVDGSQVTNVYVFNVLYSLVKEGGKAQELVGLTLRQGLEPYLKSQDDKEDLQPSLLVLDQFEELFTTHPERYEERADFFRQLRESLDTYPQLGVLLSMREDILANLDFYAAQMPDRLRTRYRMECLTADQAQAAVKGPAEQAGRPFEPGVARTLVDDLRRIQVGTVREEGATTEDRAPLGLYVEPLHLQIVCQRLWEDLPEGSTVRAEDVLAHGDVDEALMLLYEDSLSRVVKETGLDERRLRDWFEDKLITAANTRGLVFRGEAETERIPNAAVDILRDAYVLRGIRRGRDIWYELAHDRLVEPIRRANRRWREAYLDSVPWLRKAKMWNEQGRPTSLLLGGEALLAAKKWAEAHENELTDVEDSFLDACRANLSSLGRRALRWVAEDRPDHLLLNDQALADAEEWAAAHKGQVTGLDDLFLQESRRNQDIHDLKQLQDRRIRRLEIALVVFAIIAVVLAAAAYLVVKANKVAVTAQQAALTSQNRAEHGEETAVSAQETAEEGKRLAITALAAHEARLKSQLTSLATVNLPRQALPLPTPTASPKPTAAATPPGPGPTSIPSPAPTGTPTVTSTPTPNQTVTAVAVAVLTLQAELVEVHATQTALAPRATTAIPTPMAVGTVLATDGSALTRSVRIGLHGRDTLDFEESDYRLIREAGIETVKMLSFADPQVFDRIKRENPEVEIIVQLVDDRIDDAGYPTPREFADRMIPIMEVLRAYATKYEIHSEPNHADRIGGWGATDEDAAEFNEWFLEAYDLLKSTHPWASLGFPGLAIPTSVHRDKDWLELCRPAIEEADWLGVHAYWQTPPGEPSGIFDLQYGLTFVYYHQQFPTKEIEITAFGNLNVQAGYPLSEAMMAEEYVAYYQELFEYHYLHSASAFIMSSASPVWSSMTWREESGRFRKVVSRVADMDRLPLDYAGGR